MKVLLIQTVTMCDSLNTLIIFSHHFKRKPPHSHLTIQYPVYCLFVSKIAFPQLANTGMSYRGFNPVCDLLCL